MKDNAERELRLDSSSLTSQVITAAWAAYREGQITWLADRLGRIAAIVPVPVARPRKLGDMTPDERRAAGNRAMARLGAELAANADAISAALDGAVEPEPEADTSILLTAAQLREWAGLDRDLTADELAALDECIPNSSIPDAIGTIATEALGLHSDDEPETWAAAYDPQTGTYQGDID